MKTKPNQLAIRTLKVILEGKKRKLDVYIDSLHYSSLFEHRLPELEFDIQLLEENILELKRINREKYQKRKNA